MGLASRFKVGDGVWRDTMGLDTLFHCLHDGEWRFVTYGTKKIPMGTVYAVWTGVGAVGTFLIGIMFFSEAANLARFFFVGLIVVGIIGIKFSSAH